MADEKRGQEFGKMIDLDSSGTFSLEEAKKNSGMAIFAASAGTPAERAARLKDYQEMTDQELADRMAKTTGLKVDLDAAKQVRSDFIAGASSPVNLAEYARSQAPTTTQAMTAPPSAQEPQDQTVVRQESLKRDYRGIRTDAEVDEIIKKIKANGPTKSVIDLGNLSAEERKAKGLLTEAEVRVLLKDPVAAENKTREEIKKALDPNGDGKVEAEEIRKAPKILESFERAAKLVGGITVNGVKVNPEELSKGISSEIEKMTGLTISPEAQKVLTTSVAKGVAEAEEEEAKKRKGTAVAGNGKEKDIWDMLFDLFKPMLVAIGWIKEDKPEQTTPPPATQTAGAAQNPPAANPQVASPPVQQQSTTTAAALPSVKSFGENFAKLDSKLALERDILGSMQFINTNEIIAQARTSIDNGRQQAEAAGFGTRG